jgi:hypothetical protein
LGTNVATAEALGSIVGAVVLTSRCYTLGTDDART